MLTEHTKHGRIAGKHACAPPRLRRPDTSKQSHLVAVASRAGAQRGGGAKTGHAGAGAGGWAGGRAGPNVRTRAAHARPRAGLPRAPARVGTAAAHPQGGRAVGQVRVFVRAGCACVRAPRAHAAGFDAMRASVGRPTRRRV